jgi:hypothetical protein
VVAVAVVAVAEAAVDVVVAPAAPVALLAAHPSDTAASAEARHFPIAQFRRRFDWPGSIDRPGQFLCLQFQRLHVCA